MKKRLPIRGWFASLLSTALLFGSITNTTSFATEADRYSTSISDVKTEEGSISSNDRIRSIEDRANNANAVKTETKINANQNEDRLENRNEGMASDSNAMSQPKVESNHANSSHTNEESTTQKKDHKVKEAKVKEQNLSEQLQSGTTAGLGNIQNGLIDSEFIGKVTFNGSGLSQAIPDAYIEITLPAAMIQGISDGVSLFNDLNSEDSNVLGFRIDNGVNSDYIKSTNYSVATDSNGTPVLVARANLNSLTKQTDGSIEYRIHFKQDKSVPDGYILPVNVRFYYSDGEVLLETETAYFRVSYPSVSHASGVSDVILASELPDVTEAVISEEEVEPLIQEDVEPLAEVPIEDKVPITKEVLPIAKPKKQVETTDIHVDMKWEGDLPVRYLRPKSIQLHLLRSMGNEEPEVVASTTVSGIGLFEEVWSTDFFNVEKTDEAGNAYTYYIKEETGTQSGIQNYTLSNPIRSVDGTKYTLVARYKPLKLKAMIRWDDNFNEHQVRPNTVRIKLMSKVGDESFKDIGREIQVDSGTWEKDLGDYPRFDERGREIQYAISEIDHASLRNYPSAIRADGKDIPNRVFSVVDEVLTITNTVQETTIPVNIYWNEKDYGSEIRPKEVELKLIRDNGNSLTTLTKVFYGGKEGESWRGEFDNLVKYDSGGREYKYYLVESNSLHSRNYSLFNTFKSEDALNIVHQLTLTQERVRIFWDDMDASNRPLFIGLELYRNAIGEIPKLVDKVMVPNSQSGYVFDNLPKFSDDGRVYFYTIKQAADLNNYESQVSKTGNSTTIFNQFQSMNLGISLQWIEKGHEERPDHIALRLLRRTDSKDLEEVGRTNLTLSDETSHYPDIFTGLPRFAANGKLYDYNIEVVREDGLRDYAIRYDRIEENRFGITFTGSDKGISLRVDWIDEQNHYQNRPDYLDIQLYRFTPNSDVVAIGDVVRISKEQALENQNSWLLYLPDLPRLDETGKEYRYLATQSGPSELRNYSNETDPKWQEGRSSKRSEDGTLVLTNELQLQRFPVEVFWQGDEGANARPDMVSIVLNRFVNGVLDSEFSDTIQMSGKNELGYFKPVPKYDHLGREYEYKAKIVDQPSLHNYDRSMEYANGGFQFINKFQSMNVFFRMNWMDSDNIYQLRPSKIHLFLAKRLKGTNNPFEAILDHEIVFDGNYSIWTHTFRNLPKYDANGNLYEYGLYEPEELASLRNYSLSTVHSDESHEITLNAKLNLKSIEVENIWVGDLNREAERPNHIEVNLYRSSDVQGLTLYQTKSIRGIDNVWVGRFNNLPAYDENGNEYTYEVKPANVKNYVLMKTNQAGDNERVVYTHRLDTKTYKAKIQWNDLDNELGLRPSTVQVMLKRSVDHVHFVQVGDLMTVNAPNWNLSLGNLSTKDVQGNAYLYQLELVDQVGLKNYDLNTNGIFEQKDTMFQIQNTIQLQEIPVEVIWESDQAMPDELRVKLTRHGTTPIPTYTKTVNGNGQTRSYEDVFSNMPRFDAKGNPFSYTLSLDLTDLPGGCRLDESVVVDGVHRLVIR